MPIDESQFEYVGFWVRVAASLIDTVLASFLLMPLAGLLLGRGLSLDVLAASDYSLSSLLLNYLLPAGAIVWFWIARQATPGKMVFKARIVDAESGGRLT